MEQGERHWQARGFKRSAAAHVSVGHGHIFKISNTAGVKCFQDERIRARREELEGLQADEAAAEAYCVRRRQEQQAEQCNIAALQVSLEVSEAVCAGGRNI